MSPFEVLASVYLTCVSVQVVFAHQPPDIHYCFFNETTWPTSPVCIPGVQVKSSKFKFGDIFQNVINVEDDKIVPENIQVLVLRCTAQYPIRWTALKPLGTIRLIAYGSRHGLNQIVGDTGAKTFTNELSVRLKAIHFGMKFRCEGFTNSELASEIYLNKASRFLPSLQMNPARMNTLNFYISDSNIDGAQVRSTVPCVAKALPGYLRLTQPNVTEDAFRHLQLVVHNHKESRATALNAIIGNYDPRIGFQVTESKKETILDSSYSCESKISSYSYLMVPMVLEQRLPGNLYLRNHTDGGFGINCTTRNDHSVRLYIKHRMCNSILDCDLKWKPQAPHVFAATNSTNLSQGYQIVATEPYEQVFLSHPNGVKLEYNRGFLHCAGAFERHGMNDRKNSLKFVSVTDSIFTGLDGMTYLVSKGFPNSTIIQMNQVDSSDDENSSEFYILECRISTFVLLPAIKFVIESKWSEMPSIAFPGQLKQPMGAKITKLLTEKHKNVASWQLRVPASPDITKIKCEAPWMHTGEMASFTWNPDIVIKTPVGPSAAGKLSHEAVLGISFAVIVVIALVIFQVFVWRKYKSAVKEIRNLTNTEVEEFYFGNVNPGQEQSDIPLDSLPFMVDKIIKSQDLKTEITILGEGEFGIVHRGRYKGQLVAVKSSKSNADVEYFKAFLKEIKVMAFIGEHENIVLFHGAVVDRIQEKICYGVIELSPFGNLNGYLRTNSKLYCDEAAGPSTSTLMDANGSEIVLNHDVLTGFCRQIAAGMEYLSRKAVIHGDLATRNVLVFNENVVKITDFGLSRKLYNCANYTKTKQAPLPWRWMAIESLRYFDFSTKSDVWSFGVTMWEIYSLGQVPFSGVNWTTEFVDQLESGYRLMKPRPCTLDMFHWMMKCWSNQSEDRPTFTECKQFLSSPGGHSRARGNVYETSC